MQLVGGDTIAVFDGRTLDFNQGARLIERQEVEGLLSEPVMQNNFDIRTIDGNIIPPNYNSLSREPFYQIIPQQCNKNARVPTVQLANSSIPMASPQYIVAHPTMTGLPPGNLASFVYRLDQPNAERARWVFDQEHNVFRTNFAMDRPVKISAGQFRRTMYGDGQTWASFNTLYNLYASEAAESLQQEELQALEDTAMLQIRARANQ